MALPPIAIWAGAAVATVAVAGAGATYWVRANLGAPTLPTIAGLAQSPVEHAESPRALAAPPPLPDAPAKVASLEPAVAADASKPSFDIVNVSPIGDTVVAGRAAPNAKIELRDAGRVLGTATADAGGQFVIVPDALAPGSHQLSLVSGQGASVETSKAITVAVAEPPKAASLPLASEGEPLPVIAVKSVEVGPGGRFVARGEAAPNVTVRLYLSGAFVGDAKTKADGRWSLTVEHGMTEGAYKVRADQMRPDGSVEARAEAPFDFPSAMPEGKVVASAAPTSPADVVLASVQTAHVKTGDTLWGLSQSFYGDGSRYKLIFAANTTQIRDPNLIYPEQMFVVPKRDPDSASKAAAKP